MRYINLRLTYLLTYSSEMTWPLGHSATATWFSTHEHGIINGWMDDGRTDTGNQQGNHLSGKPGNVREFDSCQGNVGEKIL